MTDDQEQRTLEVIKLRIAFLQHITTLSGAAILIVLALIQRAETAEVAKELGTIAPFFVLAALVAVFSVVYLIDYIKPEVPIQGSPGKFVTFMAASMFATAVGVTAASAAGVPTSVIAIFAFSFLGLSSAALGVAVLRRKARQGSTAATPDRDTATSRPWWRRLIGG